MSHHLPHFLFQIQALIFPQFSFRQLFCPKMYLAPAPMLCSCLTYMPLLYSFPDTASATGQIQILPLSHMKVLPLSQLQVLLLVLFHIQDLPLPTSQIQAQLLLLPVSTPISVPGFDTISFQGSVETQLWLGPQWRICLISHQRLWHYTTPL